MSRVMIVNADDLGLSPGVNAGIAAGFERGIVTSASLMVRQAAAADAARCATERPGLAVGLHLDLEGRDYARGGVAAWHCDLADADAVERECRDQLSAFRQLLGRDPTHLDSHHHLHLAEPVRTAAAGLAAELGVPLRGGAVRYEGRFFARRGGGEADPAAVAPTALLAIVAELPAGWTELGCHPAAEPPPGSSYGEARTWELRTLCDPAVREAIAGEGVALASFAEID
ncbi:MAG TPA: ChbG/HpnK family deacetylase [Solirubrobacterales bacterium]|nr:ChbG/HpnK family deacetylase [Solirubrobacterales bacterium]